MASEHLEQRLPSVRDGDAAAVEIELQLGRGVRPGRGCSAQLKEDPHPQVRVAFGFEMWNPASWSPSV
jgi:hypothetical protein